MIPTAADFLKQIDEFLRETAPLEERALAILKKKRARTLREARIRAAHLIDTEFGTFAVENSKFLPRLRLGVKKGTGGIKLDVARQIDAYMKTARSRRAKAAE